MAQMIFRTCSAFESRKLMADSDGGVLDAVIYRSQNDTLARVALVLIY
jgi:hypothetical protein